MKKYAVVNLNIAKPKELVTKRESNLQRRRILIHLFTITSEKEKEPTAKLAPLFLSSNFAVKDTFF